MNTWTLLLLLATMWAPSFLLIKIGLHDIPPLTLAASRLGIAALILYATLRARGQRLPRGWDMWRRFLVMGIFAAALPFAMISLGETLASSSIAAIFNATTPIATTVLAHFFISDERLTGRRILGVLLGFAGILTIFLPGLLGMQSDASIWGMVAFTIAAVSYGIAPVYARRNLRGLAPLVGPTTQLGIGSALLLPFALGTEWNRIGMPGLPALASLLVLAVFGTAIAYVIYYKLVDQASATSVSIVTYFLPPAGVFLGIVFLDEQLSWNAIAGCILVLLGVIVINDVAGTLRRRYRKTLYTATAD